MDEEDYYGVFQGKKLLFTCIGKEKAEDMAKSYPNGEAFPVEEVDRKWVRKNK